MLQNNSKKLTRKFLFSSSTISCLAISTHLSLSVIAEGMEASQLRSGECEYAAAGEACVILVVVTTPVHLPVRNQYCTCKLVNTKQVENQNRTSLLDSKLQNKAR